MAAQVKVQSGEVGRTMTGGRPHLSPLTDSSNTSPSITQSHIITPEPKKPVPAPKPRLTPKPFAVEKRNTIKPILAPKPQTKPRPESTNNTGYTQEFPNSSEPEQSVAIVKPSPVSTNSSRPTSTSFRTSIKVNNGKTTNPAAHLFKPAPPFDSADTNKKMPPLPAERQTPKNQMTPMQGRASIARAKSLGFLNLDEKEEQNNSVTVVPPQPQPRSSRPRPVSAVFLNNPETPVPAPRSASGKPLPSDLTSKFESIGLSLHRKTTKANEKESTPKETALPQKTQQEKFSALGQKTSTDVKQSTPDNPGNDNSEKIRVQETEDQRGVSIKSRINLLLDSASASETVASGQKSDILAPELTVPESEPQVGVKQLIRQLTEDVTSNPIMKPALKPRQLATDLTKKFSSERFSDFGHVSPGETAECHEISKDPQRRMEAVNSSGKMAVEFQDDLKISSMTEIPDTEHVSSATNNESVEMQTVRASLFDNIVETASVTIGADLLRNPSLPGGNNKDEVTLVTAIYKDCVSPRPLRVNHTRDTVQAVGESRAVSESIPSAQWEDKALTLRSRRSEGNRATIETTGLIQGEPASTMAMEQQSRYLRIGSLQKWPTTDVAQEPDLENVTLKQSQRGIDMDLNKDKDRQREADHEEIAAAPKRMKTLQTAEKPNPKATYFALTGQIQESDPGSYIIESAVPYDDIGSGQEISPDTVAAIKRNLSLDATLGKNSQEKYEDVMRTSHISARQVVSAPYAPTADKMTDVVKTEQTKEDVRQNAKMKVIDIDKRRQMEMERQAILQFSQMKEREMQREFERRKAFEREKQKQTELQNQNPQELEYENMKEMEKQRQLPFTKERANQQEQEMQRRQEVERQRGLERQRELEKQRQEEMHRQKEQEKERQQKLQRQRAQELAKHQALMRQKAQEIELELMKMREQEKEQHREFESHQEQMRLKEQEKERQEELRRQKEQQKELERQRELERQHELMRLREQERERHRQLERQKELMRLKEQEEERRREVKRDQERTRLREQEEERLKEQMRLREQEMESLREQEKQHREQEIERRREVEIQHSQMKLREQEKEKQQDQVRLREQEMARLRELGRQKEQLKQNEQKMERQQDLERQQEHGRLREQELERRRELKRQQERLRQREQELEKQELKQQQEDVRLREEEMERLHKPEKQPREQDMERQQELEHQQEKVRLREQEMERRRELKRQQERLRLRQQEMERQQQLEREQEQLRQREKETERQELARQQEKVRLKEEEMERRREFERRQEQVRHRELERERLQALEPQQEQVRQEKERQRGFQKQQELDQEMQREWERQRQREEERQTELDKETLLLEMQRNKRIEELERVKEKEERKLFDQKQKEKENKISLFELEKQWSRGKAEKTTLMSVEQEMLRKKGIDREREQLRQLERDHEEETEREHLKELDRLRDLQREKQLHAEKQNQRLIQQASQNERLGWEAEREKMEKAEAEKMRQIARLQEAERQRLKDKQKKEEQEIIRLDQSPLRPKVVDVDSLLRTATSQHVDPARRWKEPSSRAEVPYKPSILDVDSFKSQSQSLSNQDIPTVSGIQEVDSNFGSILRPTPERDITWKMPPQNSHDSASPVWTRSPHDPRQLQPTDTSHSKPLHEPRKHTTKVSPERPLVRQDEHSLAPQNHWRRRQGELRDWDPFFQREATTGVPRGAPVDQVWLPRQLKSRGNKEEVWHRRRSQGSQEPNRMRSRSMSRRSVPSGTVLEKSVSRLRSRSAHREPDHNSREQQKQGVSDEDERKDYETPVGENDSQYGTWETGLRTDDSLTPATPCSESNLSPTSRNTTPSQPQDEHGSCDGLDPLSKYENEPLMFPDVPSTLLDTGVLRSRVQLGKKRAPRTRPSRAARQNTPQDGSGGATSEDWLYRDSTEKVERKMDEVDSEEQARGADAAATFDSQPQRIALFPGVDSQALKVQLKKRSDSDNQTDAPSPSLVSRSPKSPFLSRTARVLPPAGGKENGEEESPQWLKELKSKKRLSQYENEC
ncbi:trichohyalin isoform X2 [Hippocampus zosterae]|uniref:trichohyalin isoform X2 n=1 Tax=Hippocampus zosterae TaxID=109293 RepID=UPI00223D3F13|nr:trichohyalin isoform X2 [Hippocampus zosterae]